MEDQLTMSTITALPCPPSLKCMLFGGYVPPEVPGRVHSAEDTLSKYQISALNRKPRVIESPKRIAIKQSLSATEWLSVVHISEATGSSTYYVQKQLLSLLRDEIVVRRQVNKAKNERWYEYKLVGKSCK